jgi:LysM repeat protein
METMGRYRTRTEIVVFGTLLAAVLAGLSPSSSAAQSLRGSARSLTAQNVQAQAHNFTYLSTPAHVQRFVELGYLVPLRGNRDYEIDDEVSFPYARPQVRTFVERLAGQYRRACGEIMVVTSLTRPLNRQPSNASSRSVHPTGMAVDLRRSNHRPCRAWLEDVLLSLEANGVLEGTRESRPPHYHIALYPEPYTRYVDGLATGTTGTVEATETRVAAATEAGAAAAPEDAGVAAARSGAYRVRRGDALWDIAQAHGTTIAAIQRSNNLRNSRIYPGQLLTMPAAGAPSLRNVPSGSYRVRRGDALWDIARAHGTTIAAIQQSNNLLGSRIHPGQILTIPAGGEVGVQQAMNLSYRVQRGDSLWDIARAHGTTIAALRRSNNLLGSQIYPGQVLTIPTQFR